MHSSSKPVPPAEARLLKRVLSAVEWDRLESALDRDRAPGESIVEFLERRQALVRASLSVVKLVARKDLSIEAAAPMLIRQRVAAQLAAHLTLHEESTEPPTQAAPLPTRMEAPTKMEAPTRTAAPAAAVAAPPAPSRNEFPESTIAEFANPDSEASIPFPAAPPSAVSASVAVHASAVESAPALEDAPVSAAAPSWDDDELNAIFDAVSTLLPPAAEASTQIVGGMATEPLEVHQQPVRGEGQDGSSAFADSWLRSAGRGIADEEPADDVLPPGARMGRYELHRLLGQGGFGAVYASTHPALRVPVAVKVMRFELVRGAEKEAFLSEARLIAQLNHPAIVRVWDFDEDHRGRPYLVLEFVDGATLLDLLRERGKLAPAAALCVARDVALGLQAAARLGIVHKDVKPANVLIARDGTIKLTDFGVAALSDRRLSEALSIRGAAGGAVCGTVDYMPPEQARGDAVDGRADMYALGVTLYQAVTGRLPFAGDTMAQVLMKRMFENPTPPRDLVPSLPEAVSALILKMMARAPEDRYGTYVELLTAIDAAADALESTSGAVWSAAAQAAAAAPHDPEASASVWDRFKRGVEWDVLG